MKPKYHSAKTVLAPLQRLRSEGITVAQALAGTGLSLSILERPEQHVSLSQELIFLRNLRQVCGDPGIGLYVGSCYPLSLFGLVIAPTEAYTFLGIEFGARDQEDIWAYMKLGNIVINVGQ